MQGRDGWNDMNAKMRRVLWVIGNGDAVKDVIVRREWMYRIERANEVLTGVGRDSNGGWNT
jgi:hypothetical protein